MEENKRTSKIYDYDTNLVTKSVANLMKHDFDVIFHLPQNFLKFESFFVEF